METPISVYKEFPIRLLVFRTAILVVAAFLSNEVLNGFRPVIGTVFLAILAIAFFIRRKQLIYVFENEIQHNLGIPSRLNSWIPGLKVYKLNGLNDIVVVKRKSVFASPSKKFIQFIYDDGSKDVINCTLFSKSDFEQIEQFVRTKFTPKTESIEKEG